MLLQIAPQQNYRYSVMVKSERITYSETRDIPTDQLVHLYRENTWSSADKPQQLYDALGNSDTLVSAWDSDLLVGIGNAISDGHLVVYYPHLLVLPDYQGRGIGKAIMELLKAKYQGFHQHMLVADRNAVGFYERCGFRRAGSTRAMWIYEGSDH